MTVAERHPAANAVVHRFRRLAPLDPQAEAALARATERPRAVRPRRELLAEGEPVAEPLLIVDGWAARVKLLPDGRRQVIGFAVPGDLLGYCHHARPVAAATVVAMTELLVCAAPAGDAATTLEPAFALSRALDEAYLTAAVVRLGRLNARERLLDLLLELLERLTLAGLATAGQFRFPLTQEVLADALGLTSVHVNRTLQQARREGEVSLAGGMLRLADPAMLAARLHRAPTRVAEPGRPASG